jgi:hypothetical protein
MRVYRSWVETTNASGLMRCEPLRLTVTMLTAAGP